MAEYINREDVKGLININFSGLLAAIDLIPAADVVPVVRCKDCKYNRHNGRKCLHPDSIILTPDDNDFCSYGKRVEENNGQ